MESEEIQKLLIYRDAMMLVLNKPGGVPVHKGFGGGETVDDWVEELRFGLPKKPSLAHRLDKDTSGCLILGRHTEALRRLSHMFANNLVKKTYWAVVEGRMIKDEGRIDLPLAKKELGKHRWHMKADPNGQVAITDYRVLREFDGFSWLELKPQTGRTHQLRVHCAEMGCPILGDKIYGRTRLPQGGGGGGSGRSPSLVDTATLHPTSRPSREEGNLKLHLHARSVEVPLYPKKPGIYVEAEAPGYFLDKIAQKIAKSDERGG